MNVRLNHKVLKGLRESRSIPMKAMPEKLGISLEDYKGLESNDNTVDVIFADRVAGIFKHNWSVFLLDDAPPTNIGKHDHRTTENQTPTFHEETVDALEDADFVLEFSSALGTSDSLKLPNKEELPYQSPAKLGVKMRELSGINLEDQIKFKDASEAFKSWTNYIESCGIHILQYPINEKDNIRAFSAVRKNSAVIVLNSGDTQKGRIFSLLHEFCHILLRNSGICDLHNSKNMDSEVFCNQFAASFLTPINFIQEYVGKVGKEAIVSNINEHARKIAGRLKVSPLVITRRFATVGLIDNKQYSRLHDRYLDEFRARREQKNKDDDKQRRSGPTYYTIKRLRNGISYSDKVFNALDTGKITSVEASHALGVSEKYLSNFRNNLVEAEASRYG